MPRTKRSRRAVSRGQKSDNDIEVVDILNDDSDEAEDPSTSPRETETTSKVQKGKGKGVKAKVVARKSENSKDKSAAKRGSAGRNSNAETLKKAKADDDLNEEDKDESISDADEAEWEVERILDMKVLRDGNKEFQVKWKGYPLSNSTWEPEENLTACAELLELFKASLEKDDIPRTRRLTTVHSTKSSKHQKIPTSADLPNKTGRISKSRTTTLPPRKSGSIVTEHKLASPEAIKNGSLSLQKFMRTSVNSKIQKLEPVTKTSATNSSGEEDEDYAIKYNSRKANARNGRWRSLGRTLSYCGAAAASVGLGTLLYTSPSAISWSNVGPQFETFIAGLREQVFRNNNV